MTSAKERDKYADARKALNEQRPKPKEPPTLPPCPLCGTRALGLWKAWGASFLKCERCGHEIR